MTEEYQFFPDCVREQLPALYSTEHERDPLMICKFFTPDSAWTWFASKFDGEDIFFGWVDGLEKVLGYFSLSELQEVKGRLACTLSVTSTSSRHTSQRSNTGTNSRGPTCCIQC